MDDQRNPKRLLTVGATAEYLGIRPGSIYNRLSEGTFPIKPKRIGKLVRFDIRDLDSYVDGLGK